jgi:hypothetical protein
MFSTPFEINVHDALISAYQHSAYEVETNLYQAPGSKSLKSKVFYILVRRN